MRPRVPPDHPMKDYAEYMLGRIDSVYTLQWFLLISILFLTLTFAIFAYQKWRDRKATNKQTDVLENLAKQCGLVLSTVKGWVVIHVEEEKKKKNQMVETKEEIKAEIKGSVQATADAVVQKIEEKATVDASSNLFDSKTGRALPLPKLPPSPPGS